MVCRLYVRLCLMAFTYLLIRYFYIYTFGYTDPITTREIGFAFEAMLESMPQIFHTASIWSVNTYKCAISLGPLFWCKTAI